MSIHYYTCLINFFVWCVCVWVCIFFWGGLGCPQKDIHTRWCENFAVLWWMRQEEAGTSSVPRLSLGSFRVKESQGFTVSGWTKYWRKPFIGRHYESWESWIVFYAKTNSMVFKHRDVKPSIDIMSWHRFTYPWISLDCIWYPCWLDLSGPTGCPKGSMFVLSVAFEWFFVRLLCCFGTMNG